MIEGELTKRLKRLEEKQREDFEYLKGINEQWNEVIKIYVKSSRLIMWSSWAAIAILLVGAGISMYVSLSRLAEI